ncbi:MAG: sensor histidine kinase [Bacteroidota bacterium]
MTNKKQLYWLLQIGGWALYTLVNYLSLPLFDISLPYSELYFLLSGVIGIGVTHFYRRVIREYRWFQLNIIKLIRNVLVGSLLASVFFFIALTLMDACLFVCAFFVFNLDIKAPTISFDTYGAYIYLSTINVYCVFLLWSLLYFVFQYFESFQKAKYGQVLAQSQLKDATLLNLRNQINPHFLFNALNSIRSLTLSDTGKAREAVTLLSEILRYTLNSERQSFVYLKDELAVVRNYLELEKIRFDQRLNYSMQMSGECGDIQIPPLIVMTLAENAIKHGIGQLKNGGDIALQAYIHEHNLEIHLNNSGTLSQLNQTEHNGIGLNNTRQRLTMLYNGKAQFEIRQLDTNHVTAIIKIPLTT